MDNIGIVVEDLPRMVAFFQELGLVLEGEMRVEGPWVDHCIGLEGAVSDIAMMRTPGGGASVELQRYIRPEAVMSEPQNAPSNTLGIRRIMFEVDDIDAMVGRLRKHGGEVLDQIVQYEHVYRLCYLRGPEGILIALAQKLTQ
ncbi:MAG: VOC family protein [Bacteroidetes bacterium]|nr:VOC family protein [Bacteroidota bacterium]